MGACLSKILEVILGKKECNILIVGLDGAGKTTILKKLNLGEIVATMPTIGFHVESVEYKNWTFTALDLPVHLKPLLKHYCQNTQGVIFVVDSNDRERIDDCSNKYSARKQLHGLLTNFEFRDPVLLVYANKQDVPNAMSLNEVAERLGLEQLRTRQWYLQSTSAVNGKGLYEGLDWLSNTLNKNQN